MEADIVVEEDTENRSEANAPQTQECPDAEGNNENDQIDDEIRVLAEEVQNRQNDDSKDEELEKTTKVMETSTDAPQNSGDGGNLAAEISKTDEHSPSPGNSNSNVIKKKRRNVQHALIKREMLPRKSKTKAYEYLRNIARGFFNVATGAVDKRRVVMQRKRFTRIAKSRRTKYPPVRRARGGRRSVVRRPRVEVRDSGMSISSGVTDTTGSSNVSSRFNDCYA